MQHAEAPARTLTELYRAGVEAAAPGPALAAALARDFAAIPQGRIWIAAIGKAAHAMASAAVDFLATAGRAPAGGVVIGPAPGPEELPGLQELTGDHPFPGPGSLAAARGLQELAGRTSPGDEVWVLLSGGATSLAAAPVNGIPPADLFTLYRDLLSCGLDIVAMNTIRKRFSRWGAGRLAVALHPARVRTYTVSDVIGDDPSAIGSGPTVADVSRAAEVRRLIDRAGLARRLPAALEGHLRRAAQDPALETPKPAHPAFVKGSWRVVAGNRASVDAVAERAAGMGFAPVVLPDPVQGEAAAAGRRLARSLLGQAPGACLVAGGETVVRVEPGSPGTGGRCQELALAAAEVLAGTGGATLLAAGTDGRDGPTDAAGGLVDGATWERIVSGGGDPAADLAAHNSHPALDSAGALLRTGLTGTNVMDLVIGLKTGPQ